MGFKNQLDESTGNQRIAFLSVSAGPKCILHKNAFAFCAANRADLPSQKLILLMILWSSNVVPFSDIFDSSLLASEQSQADSTPLSYGISWRSELGELAKPLLKEWVINFLLMCISQLIWPWLSHQVQEHCEGVGQLGNLQFCVVLELPGHGCLTQMWGGEKTVLNVTSYKLCFYRTVSAKLSLNSEHNLYWSFGFPWRPGLLLVL